MTGRLRFLAEVNPSTPEFDQLAGVDEVSFMPLETVWADERLDTSRVRPKAEVSSGYVRFRNGDVLCPKVTPTFQAGRSALVDDLTNGVGAATTEVHAVRAREGLADPRFIRYQFLTKAFLEEGVSRFQGVAGLQRVPDDFLRDLPVADLELEEQRRIADFLDDQTTRIDQTIEARQQQIALLTQAEEATIEEIIWCSSTDGVQLRRLGTSVTTGPFGTVFASTDYVPDGIPMINPTHIVEGRLVPEPEHSISSETAARLRRHRLCAGDVITGRKGDLGRSAMIGPDADGWVCGSDAIAVHPNTEALEPAFLDLVLHLPRVRAELVSRSPGATMPSLNEGMLLSLPVPSADLAEQRRRTAEGRIARIAFQEGRTSLVRSITLHQEFKRSLISAAVLGEFDVSAASGRGVPA